MPSEPHIFGIRHHGPGSARSLVRALESLSPDCLLVEGPPDAESILPFAAHAAIQPPVALLIYGPEQLRRSVYYPFAEFSPEWQAIRFGLARNVPVRFIDLPQSVQMGLAAKIEAEEATPVGTISEADPVQQPEPSPGVTTTDAMDSLRADPLTHLAKAAGFTDGERWWEHLVEHRRGGEDVFAAVLEAMTALREAALPTLCSPSDAERETLREAHMRQALREAQRDGFERIAVVCGAWHAPALARRPSAREDAARLKGLPKLKVAATWIPWTHGRLALASGYGAGIESPGWYEFLWQHAHASGTELTLRWLIRVGRLLRGEDLDASSASVIEAVRLAESLAALRGQPLPGLSELNEATRCVLCFGDALPLRLIERKLVIGERLGSVPEEAPSVPLARNLAQEQKRLRFPPEATHKDIDLDLRKPNDLDRSRLLHRLRLLAVSWGEQRSHSASRKGTFHEFWSLQWRPEFSVALIEAAVWGNAIADAASAKASHDADASADLPALTALLDTVLLADLPAAASRLMTRLQSVAAVSSDVAHLMDALPPLAGILRYGHVRKTDTAMVGVVTDGMVARITIGLPVACGSLDDEAAEAMVDRLRTTHAAIDLLQSPEHTEAWRGALQRLIDLPGIHGLVAGRACRLLYESGAMDPAEMSRRVSLALSSANPPAQAAAWIDGLLRDGGLLLLHDETLWNVLDAWISQLPPAAFLVALPLLRRTFSHLSPAERRQLGERAANGQANARPPRAVLPTEFDEARANQVLPLLAKLLGLHS